MIEKMSAFLGSIPGTVLTVATTVATTVSLVLNIFGRSLLKTKPFLNQTFPEFVKKSFAKVSSAIAARSKRSIKDQSQGIDIRYVQESGNDQASEEFIRQYPQYTYYARQLERLEKNDRERLERYMKN